MDRSVLWGRRQFKTLSPNSWRLADVGATHAFLRSELGWGDLTGWNWTRLIERIDLEQGSHPCRRRGSARNRSLPSCARSRCSWPRTKASRSPARMPPSKNKAQGRVPRAGDLLQSQRSPGRRWRLAGPLQSRAASLISGLPATCACYTGGRRTAATHSHNHAVGSQYAWSKTPIRSAF